MAHFWPTLNIDPFGTSWPTSRMVPENSCPIPEISLVNILDHTAEFGKHSVPIGMVSCVTGCGSIGAKLTNTWSAIQAAITTVVEHLRGACREFVKTGAADTNMTWFDENLARTQNGSWCLFNANILLAVVSRSAHHLVRRSKDFKIGLKLLARLEERGSIEPFYPDPSPSSPTVPLFHNPSGRPREAPIFLAPRLLITCFSRYGDPGGLA